MVISLSLPWKGDPKSPNFVGTKGSEIQAFCWRIVCMSTPRFMRRLVRRFQLRVHVSMIFGRFRDSGSLEKQKNLKMMIVFWNHFKKKTTARLRCESFEKNTHVDVFYRWMILGSPSHSNGNQPTSNFK